MLHIALVNIYFVRFEFFSDTFMPGCYAVPDINTVYLGTYHHTTQDTLIDAQPTYFVFDFTGVFEGDCLLGADISSYPVGVGIYVYCVLANNLGNDTGTKADYSFSIDGDFVYRFVHDPDQNTNAYDYNVPGEVHAVV